MSNVMVSDLSGISLDWAVAKAEGFAIFPYAYQHGYMSLSLGNGEERYEPSCDWGQGGPLIEKHKVVIVYHNGPDGTPMASTRDRSPAFESGETVLIAAMRAIVAAKLGDTVDVPEELLDVA